ncbi:MAG: hypothetical protein ABS882_05490 [Lysinibacillus sp.]
MTASKQCPKCSSNNVADILYGLPTSSAMKQVTIGKAVLGGFVISTNSLQFHCNNCEYRWADEYLVIDDMSN